MGNPVYTCLPVERASDPITELALDLRWSWNHASDALWRELEPELWEATQNPWLILQAVSHDKLLRLLATGAFRDRVDALLEAKRKLERTDAWFQGAHPDAPFECVAYFSMEYMLSEALPIYSGGLGNVAGDQLKAASDLGIPVVGIGLLYQQGYFRQEIDASGAQVAQYPFNEPGQLPIRPLRTESGDWLRLKVALPGGAVWIRAWEAQVGRRRLYLLDTNDPANLPAHRSITSELYGGGPETRLRQETVLGIGGWRLLRTLGIRPEVCHLNEGHAAFAVLERALSFMEDHGQPFSAALAATRAGNLFTTHTAVPAGIDRFAPDLFERYFKTYAEVRLKIPIHDLLALGRRNPDDSSEPFNMAYLAIHGSGAVNGVSRLHGHVSRMIFEDLFPRWPKADVPIGYVTNGVHVPSWDSPEADELWTNACGQQRWVGTLEYVGEQIRCAKDNALWELRSAGRKTLVEFVRRRVGLQLAAQGASESEIEAAAHIFNENVLTLGFARRFATYKRPNMLLQDPDRLIRILTNPSRPAQLVIAGKAHPQDWPGQALIKEWTTFLRRPEVRGHVAFLSDYDLLLTQQLAAGVDVWLNTPRRPWEACGTSGMKVLANGGLNISELDGWWSEAYSPEVGWAIGDGRDRGDDPGWDRAEADALYTILETEVAPAFYARENGIPTQWVARMRDSMARLTPAFSANRTMRQYTERYYIPLAAAYYGRATDSGKAAADLVAWQHSIAARWHDLHFGSVVIDRRDGKHFYTVQVHLGTIGLEEVQIEIYADPLDGEEPRRIPMTANRPAPGSPGFFEFTGIVPGDRPAEDHTARAIPRKLGALVPLEIPLIAWQK